MSSQSSTHSRVAPNDQDEVCSYSSGWERSSSSEYMDLTDNEEYEENEFCPMGAFYTPYKTTGATKIFDMDYECDLVVLPHPYRRKEEPVVAAENKNNTDEPPEAAAAAAPINPTNPWKRVEPSATPVDPWSFLNAHKEKERPRRPVPQRNSNTSPAGGTRLVVDNSNTNKLCKYKDDCRMNKNNSCNMAHSLSKWKPKLCRFNNGCRRKASCSYYHTGVTLSEYLRVMIQTPETIYAKNAALYKKYLSN